jgi:hypothetical protein
LCWFHLRQSGYRWLQKSGEAKLLNSELLYTGGVIGGGRVHYKFCTWIRMVYALAYVPTEHVLEVYETIEWPDILLAFISQYFESWE